MGTQKIKDQNISGNFHIVGAVQIAPFDSQLNLSNDLFGNN